MKKKKDYYEEIEIEVCCEDLSICENIEFIEDEDDIIPLEDFDKVSTDYETKLFWYVNCRTGQPFRIFCCPFCGQKLKEKK